MMEGKPDLRPCPFCGGHGVKVLELVHGGVCYALCDICKAATRCFDTPKNAAEAWNRRAEPENRVLTLKELEAHCKGGADSAPVWIEFYFNPGLGRWVLVCAPDMTCVTPEACSAMTIKPYTEGKHWQGHYEKLWRCWLRKPTAEEMANIPWEE